MQPFSCEYMCNFLVAQIVSQKFFEHKMQMHTRNAATAAFIMGYFLGQSAVVHSSAPVPAVRLYLLRRYRCHPAALGEMEYVSAGEWRITNPPIRVQHCKCRTAGADYKCRTTAIKV